MVSFQQNLDSFSSVIFFCQCLPQQILLLLRSSYCVYCELFARQKNRKKLQILMADKWPATAIQTHKKITFLHNHSLKANFHNIDTCFPKKKFVEGGKNTVRAPIESRLLFFIMTFWGAFIQIETPGACIGERLVFFSKSFIL